MKMAWVIGWKDFKALVTTPMFFGIAAMCSLIWSFVYLRALLQFAGQAEFAAQMPNAPQMNLHYSVFVNHMSYVNIIFIFAIPALTMRLIAEEKKMRTYDLLLTAPITATDIAVGKFLSGFLGAAALIAISFFYPLITVPFASFPWIPLLTSYLGMLLVAGCYVAVGLFASSLTDSVVLAVIMGLIFNLILWFVAQGAGFSDNPTFTAVMEHLAIGQHFFSFLKGTLKISSTVFFLSTIFLFVFLSQRVVESSRWR